MCLALLVRPEVGQLRSPIALRPLRLLPYLYALSMLFRPYGNFYGNHASTGLQVIPHPIYSCLESTESTYLSPTPACVFWTSTLDFPSGKTHSLHMNGHVFIYEYETHIVRAKAHSRIGEGAGFTMELSKSRGDVGVHTRNDQPSIPVQLVECTNRA